MNGSAHNGSSGAAGVNQMSALQEALWVAGMDDEENECPDPGPEYEEEDRGAARGMFSRFPNPFKSRQKSVNRQEDIDMEALDKGRETPPADIDDEFKADGPYAPPSYGDSDEFLAHAMATRNGRDQEMTDEEIKRLRIMAMELNEKIEQQNQELANNGDGRDQPSQKLLDDKAIINDRIRELEDQRSKLLDILQNDEGSSRPETPIWPPESEVDDRERPPPTPEPSLPPMDTEPVPVEPPTHGSYTDDSRISYSRGNVTPSRSYTPMGRGNVTPSRSYTPMGRGTVTPSSSYTPGMYERPGRRIQDQDQDIRYGSYQDRYRPSYDSYYHIPASVPELFNAVKKRKELQRKYEPVQKEVENLIERLKNVPVAASVVSHPPPNTGQGDMPDSIPYSISAEEKQKLRMKRTLEQALKEKKTTTEPTKQEIERIEQALKENENVKEAVELLRSTNSLNTFKKKLIESLKNGQYEDVLAKVVALDLYCPPGNKIEDYEAVPDYKQKPLFTALKFERKDSIKLIIEHHGPLLENWFYKNEAKGSCYSLTPLHMALFIGDLEIINRIIEFIPVKSRKAYLSKKIDIESYKDQPYGELPLSALTWTTLKCDRTHGCPNEDLKNTILTLVKNGNELDDRTEKDGNTLLHLIVLQSLECARKNSNFSSFLSEVFEPVAREWWKKLQPRRFGNPILHLLRIKNKAQLTPLTLAANKESPIYLDLVQWEDHMRIGKSEGTQYTEVVHYRVTDVDNIDRQGSYNDTSVMHVVAHNDIDLCSRGWDVDITDTEPLKTLIKQKWHFYQVLFYGWGLVHIIYMVLLTYYGLTDLSKSFPPSGSKNGSSNTNKTVSPNQTKQKVHSFFAFLLIPILYLIFETIDFINLLRSLRMRFAITGNSLYRSLSILFSVFTIAWTALYFTDNSNKDIIFAMSMLFGWMFGIFFTRTISFPSKDSQIGAFSIMMQRMLFHDLIPFLLISLFIIISFSTAVQATLNFSLSSESNLSYGHTFYQMIKYLAGLDDPMGEDTSKNKQFVKALLVIYGIIIVVLMVNMLIAAMNKTYDMIRETRCNLVSRQRLSILLLLERRLCTGRWVKHRFCEQEEWGKNPSTKEYFITVIRRSILKHMMKKFDKT